MTPDPRRLKRLADDLKPLASVEHIRVLMLLNDGERRSEDVRVELGSTRQGASEHIQLLVAAGIVATRREGRAILYSLTMRGVEMVELFRKLAALK